MPQEKKQKKVEIFRLALDFKTEQAMVEFSVDNFGIDPRRLDSLDSAPYRVHNYIAKKG